jgi:hypothetical protein
MSLFQNPKPVIKYILLFLAILIATVWYATRADAAELDISYGRTLLRGPTDVASVTVLWPKQVGDIDLYAGTILIGSYQYGGAPYGNNVVLRTGFTAHAKNFGVSFGVADLQHEDRMNSGSINFNLGMEYRWQHAAVCYMHISNAGSHEPNLGRDMLVVSWRFK